jgi:hypothetical protein
MRPWTWLANLLMSDKYDSALIHFSFFIPWSIICGINNLCQDVLELPFKNPRLCIEVVSERLTLLPHNTVEEDLTSIAKQMTSPERYLTMELSYLRGILYSLDFLVFLVDL